MNRRCDNTKTATPNKIYLVNTNTSVICELTSTNGRMGNSFHECRLTNDIVIKMQIDTRKGEIPRKEKSRSLIRRFKDDTEGCSSVEGRRGARGGGGVIREYKKALVQGNWQDCYRSGSGIAVQQQ